MCFLQFGVWSLPSSSYLTVLHSITEEIVQQQVLQVSVPVKRFFDFAKENTGEREITTCDVWLYTFFPTLFDIFP